MSLCKYLLTRFCPLYFQNSLKIVQRCSGSQDLSSIEMASTVVSTKSLGDAFYLSLGKKGYGSGIRMISLIDYKWYYSYCACAALVKTTAAMRHRSNFSPCLVGSHYVSGHIQVTALSRAIERTVNIKYQMYLNR